MIFFRINVPLPSRLTWKFRPCGPTLVSDHQAFAFWVVAYGRFDCWEIKGAFTLGSRELVSEYNTRWALMWTHLFLSTRARIRARFQCPSRGSRPCTGTKVGTGSLCARFSVGSEWFYLQSTTSLLLQKWRLLKEQSRRKTTWVPKVWTKHHFEPVPGN